MGGEGLGSLGTQRQKSALAHLKLHYREKKKKKKNKHILVKQISESPKKSEQVAVTGNTLSKKAITCLCFTFLVK